MLKLFLLFDTIVSTTQQVSQGATGSVGMSKNILQTVVMWIVVVGIFYFLLIRPQKQKEKAAKEMISLLEKGDKVITIGGVHGRVDQIKDKTIIIKVEDGGRIEFEKEAIIKAEDGKKSSAQKKNVESNKDEKKPNNNDSNKSNIPHLDIPKGIN